MSQQPGGLPPDQYSEPKPEEIESARLLANQAKGELEEDGLTEEQVRKLANDYVAETDGEPSRFVEWARRRATRGVVPTDPTTPEGA